MSILDEVQEGLKKISKTQKTTKKGDFTVGMSILDEDFHTVQKKIDKIIQPYLRDGEKIISKLDGGEIFDGGKVYFKIMGGYVTEFYYYKTLTSLFIRNYHISDGETDWTAVYVDQNNKTPWWDKKDLS